VNGVLVSPSTINPEISLCFFRPPEGDWILIRSRTRAGANGAGLTMASQSDRKGAFAEVMQAMTFERRAAQAEAP
jgi:acyl-CoA thioesterase